MKESVRAILRFAWEAVQSVTFALGIFVVLYAFLITPAEVLGGSSYPNLQTNERLITEKISYYFSPPQRGDFVLVQSPQNPDVDFIKRIVGLPGEIIRLEDGAVYINGQKLDEIAYLPPNTHTGPGDFLPDSQDYVIPPNSYFVMGDNREHSFDSRFFGPITRNHILSRAVFRFWPPDRFGLLNR